MFKETYSELDSFFGSNNIYSTTVALGSLQKQ